MASPLAGVSRALRRVAVESRACAIVARAGMIGVEPPHKLLAMYRALDRYGVLGGDVMIAAIRHGRRPALIDDAGSVSFRDLDERSNALANAWRERGLGEGLGVAILCRNHRGLLDATFATAKIGGRALYLNTEFSGPQAAAVCGREGADVIVYDEDLADVVAKVDAPKGRYIAWEATTAEPALAAPDQPAGQDRPAPSSIASARVGRADGLETLAKLIATGDPKPPPRPAREGVVVLLTSGTTGTPKGAPRSQQRSLVLPAGILSKIPFRRRGTVLVASPMFHAWGFVNSLLAIGLGSTLVVHRRFDPRRTLDALAEHRCTALVVVPILLQRILSMGEAEIRERDLSELRIIAASGAQLDGALAAEAASVFGEVVYNLYGSTEVAYAAIATPEDLKAAPGCVGHPPFGTRLRILGPDGTQVSAGETGRVFVGSSLVFEGYTGGGSKDVADGYMATGDVGHFDGDGRLHLDGRDDEMIISGGENVFPREIEELLVTHEAVLDAAAIGVADEGFGQRLRVFVVVRPGHHLDAQEVRVFARSNLARFKVPRDVVFVEELPRTSTGKVLKRELAKLKVD